MLAHYPACFYKEKNGYSVIFPDLDVATCGDSLDDAIRMAIDLLAGQLYFAKKENQEVVKPSAVKDIKPETDFEYEEYFVNIVSVDVEEYAKTNFERPIKKTLSIPKWLNDTAVARNVNFSQVLQAALKEKLHVA